MSIQKFLKSFKIKVSKALKRWTGIKNNLVHLINNLRKDGIKL
jgi:hypothetical protein